MTKPNYDDQVRQLQSIAEELTGDTWPTYPSDVIIEGELDGEIADSYEHLDPVEPEQPGNQVAIRDPFAEWELRRGELALVKFDKNAWADLQEGKVESLANRVARLERDVPEFAVPAPAPAREREVRIYADIADRYGVARMVEGHFDDTVRTAPVQADVADSGLPLFPQFDPNASAPAPRQRGLAVLIDDHDDASTMRFEQVPARPPAAAPVVDQLFWGKPDRKPRKFGRKGGRRRG